MDTEKLRQRQRPLKEKYTKSPGLARQTLTATANMEGDCIGCSVGSFLGEIPCGLHPATGGDGTEACSAEMLLEALVGCAGVTLRAVATAMEIPMRKGSIIAEGEIDFAGTLGINKQVPVGFKSIRLKFDLDIDADPKSTEKLIELTERYCVVYQTLRNPCEMRSELLGQS